MQRNSADLFIGVSEISVVYYVVALLNTVAPGYEEAKAKGPNKTPLARKLYKIVWVGNTGLATVKLDQLEAQTPYQVYCYA